MTVMMMLEHHELFLLEVGTACCLDGQVVLPGFEPDLTHLGEELFKLNHVHDLLLLSQLSSSERAHLIDGTEGLLGLALGAFVRVASATSS